MVWFEVSILHLLRGVSRMLRGEHAYIYIYAKLSDLVILECYEILVRFFVLEWVVDMG